MIALIVGCEVAFWITLGLGLLARYGLRRRRLGAVLLTAVPLVDLVLFLATVTDLRNGAEPRQGHGLAALYLGFSVAFGHDSIRWADGWFAHLFAGCPRPARLPRRGWERARHEWRLFGHAVLASAISALLLVGAILLVGDSNDTAALRAWFPRLGAILFFWLVFGPLIDTPLERLTARRRS